MKIQTRIREVCGVEYADDLNHLQRVILPLDTPYNTAKGWWWLAWGHDVPVAFAGLSPTKADRYVGFLSRSGVLLAMRGQGLQKRLIRARLCKAKALGMHTVVTDTQPGNFPSSNSLISCGFKLYSPAGEWAAKGTLYWILRLKR